MKVVGFDGGDHALVHGAAADVDSFDTDGFGEDGSGVDELAFAGEDADEVDVAAGGDGFEGEREGAGAAHFYDVVCATVVGEAEDFAIPFWGRSIIDGFVGA